MDEPSLKIGFDAKRLFNNFTGLGNYSRTLLNNLIAYYPENEYHLFTPKVQDNQETKPFLHHPALQLHLPTTRFKNYWRTRGIKKNLERAKIDLFHGLSHEIPIGIQTRSIQSVVTIHDLIFKYYPKDFPLIDRTVYNRKFRYACQQANLVIAISENTKQDIIEFYGTAAEKVKVIYQTCHDRFKIKLERAIIHNILQKHELPENFALYVGSVIKRKNLEGIIRAVALLPKAIQLPIIVIGRGKEYKKHCLQLIERLKLQHLFHFPEIRFNELPALYQAAQLFLYPSYYEGFGIPIIEALYSACPVLTSNVSSLPEAAGGGGHYVDPQDSEAIAAGMEKMLSDSIYRIQLIEKGQQHLSNFDAQVLTNQLMSAYRSL